jgi:hypothetical protein
MTEFVVATIIVLLVAALIFVRWYATGRKQVVDAVNEKLAAPVAFDTFICSCKDRVPEDLIELHYPQGGVAYQHRVCDSIVADVTDIERDAVKLIGHFMREERRDLFVQLQPWIDMAVAHQRERIGVDPNKPVKLKSPLFEGVLMMKSQLVDHETAAALLRKEIDRLRTMLWGRTCVYCETPDSAVKRVPDGRPICADCDAADAYRHEQAQEALARAQAGGSLS